MNEEILLNCIVRLGNLNALSFSLHSINMFVLAIWSEYPVVWAAVVITVILVWIAAFWHGLTVKRYEVETDRIEEGHFVRIVQISDLHSCKYGKNQKSLLTNVIQLMPDMIVMTGDNVDDIKKRENAYALLEGLKELGVPAYYVIGNHEYRIPDIDNVYKKLDDCNVRILDMRGEKVRVGGALVYIAGTPDPFVYKDDTEYAKEFVKAFKDISNIKQFRILLAHRPEKWKLYSDTGFDLAFSGHAHGGQVRIPKLLNGLYSPHQGLFPKRAGGIYADNGFVHIVSRGLSKFWDMPRVFNPPELILCVLCGTSKKKK